MYEAVEETHLENVYRRTVGAELDEHGREIFKHHMGELILPHASFKTLNVLFVFNNQIFI